MLAVLLAAAGCFTAQARAALAEDYAAIFGGKYADAEQFLRQNAWIAGALQLPPDDTRIAVAVVFPEIIRFSALEDDIQVRGLKVLYVQYGRAYMDFSVGRFQMKPSFVEHLEEDSGRLLRGGVEDRLRFYATAYNVGYLSGDAALRQMMNKRRFHIALLFPTATYNYADVALFYFRAH